MAKTIEITTSQNFKFSVEYEVETLPSMDKWCIDIKKISIGIFELEFYAFKILHEDIFQELVEKCKHHEEIDADDLKSVNIG